MNIIKSFTLWAAISCYAIPSSLFGFVLVSGSKKAKLPVSVESPTIQFFWDGKAPGLEKVDEFSGGEFEGLENEEIMENLLLKAFQLWNDIPGSYVNLELQTDPNAVADEEDHTFSITIGKVKSQSTAAFAIPTIEEENVIADCDISISDRTTAAKTLAYTIAHEMGHCLGLGHNHTNYGAIMGYSRDVFSLKLGADDIAGLMYLYPDPDYVDEDPKEIICGVITAKSPETALPLQIIYCTLALLLLPLALVSLSNSNFWIKKAKPVRS